MTAARPSVRPRQLVAARSGAYCEIGHVCGPQGAYLPNVATDVHHRHPAKSGGSRLGWVHAPSNLLAACRPCHSFVERERLWAVERGLLLPMGTARPLSTPVDCRHGRVLLDDAGTWTYAVIV